MGACGIVSYGAAWRLARDDVLPGANHTPARRNAVRTRAITAVYAATGVLWLGFARGAMPPVIAAAYRGANVPLLSRFFRHHHSHPLDHYLALWNALAGAVLIAGAMHLAVVLIALRFRAAQTGRALVVFAAIFLALTVLSGPRHDYVADLEMWNEVLGGRDPWWIVPERAAPLNAYGPLFNVLAGLAWINPLAPKLLFALAYIVCVAWLLETLGGLALVAAIAWLLNPFPWVEIAYFGHFDVLVAVACVAAVHARIRNRDGLCGLSLAAGVLIKYLPIVVLPFLALDGRRLRPRVLLAAVPAIALGLALSAAVWGPSTFRPLVLAASRGSNQASIYRFLKGTYSPLALFGVSADVDRLAVPCLAAAGLAVFAWCQVRRVEIGRASVLAVLTTLLFYQVGFLQYQMVLFLLVSYWLAVEPGRLAGDRFLAAALVAYFAWLALFEVFSALIGGVVHPGDPWAWVDEVAGLPTFLLGAALLAALLRPTFRRSTPAETVAAGWPT